MKPKYTYIPFGTRCSSASILKEYLHKRNASLPFDWIDISLKALVNFIPEERAEIDRHVVKYLNGVIEQRHSVDDTWFVHDFPKGRPATTIELELICEKYIRRFNRLFDILEGGGDGIVLLTIMPRIDADNEAHYHKAVRKISFLTKQTIYPVVVNLKAEKFIYGPTVIVVPFKDDWDKFHKEIADRLKNIKEFF